MVKTIAMNQKVVKNQVLYFPHNKTFFANPYQGVKEMDNAKLMSDKAADLMVKYYASQDIVARKVRVYLLKDMFMDKLAQRARA